MRQSFDRVGDLPSPIDLNNSVAASDYADNGPHGQHQFFLRC
jgi:hypothetical protein